MADYPPAIAAVYDAVKGHNIFAQLFKGMQFSAPVPVLRRMDLLIKLLIVEDKTLKRLRQANLYYQPYEEAFGLLGRLGIKTDDGPDIYVVTAITALLPEMLELMNSCTINSTLEDLEPLFKFQEAAERWAPQVLAGCLVPPTPEAPEPAEKA